MLLAYFDTNVFDHVLNRKGSVSATDEARLRLAIKEGRLHIVSSILNISETLGAMHSTRPEVTIPQLSLIMSLCDPDYYVKPHNLLLTDDLKHFAWNGEADRAFLSSDIASRLQFRTRRLIEGQEDGTALNGLIVEDSGQKSKFLNGVADAQRETSPQVKELRAQGEVPTFAEYFNNGKELFARTVADSFGLAEKCEDRGLSNLLRIPSLATMVRLGMSFIYRTAVEGKRPRSSASRDLQHAPTSAASSDFFVTHDGELALLLKRVPIPSLRVVRLDELLQSI